LVPPRAGRSGLCQPPDPHGGNASAPDVRQVTLGGNLTADPVLNQLDDDRNVCQLRLAANDENNQPMFIDVATFGVQADVCSKYLSKGRAVALTRRLV